MFIDKDRLFSLNEYTERIKALYKAFDFAVVDEGHNYWDLFLTRLIEELVLNIKNYFTHYNLLALNAQFWDSNTSLRWFLFSQLFSLVYVLIIISF